MIPTEDELRTIFARQDEIARHQPVCPACGERKQIQITDQVVPARWRCRICYFSFTSEPRKADEA